MRGRHQASFSRLWDGFETDDAAKLARDVYYRELKQRGFKVRRFVLKNQLREWASFGVPDGRSCDVYMLDILSEPITEIDDGMGGRYRPGVILSVE